MYQRLSTLPGSTSAALTDRVPLTGGQTPAPVAIGGRPLPPLSERPQANRHLVSPRYFATLGIPILAGRDFDERDSSRVPHVVIVNETFARRHFPGENPIGRTLVTGMAQLPSQIVGVVADVRSTSLNTPPEADYFLPALQRPEAFTNILVRTNVSPAAMPPVVREALRSVDPDLPLLQPQPLSARVARTVADHAMADLAREAHLVRDHHHRHALLRKLHHDVEHFAHHFRVERGRGLVEQHHDRVHRQRARDRHALLLAAGELAGELVLVRDQAHAVEHLEAALQRLVLVAAEHLDLRERQVLGDRQVRKQLEVLEHHPAARAQLGQVGLRIGDRDAVDDDVALLERLQRIDAS